MDGIEQNDATWKCVTLPSWSKVRETQLGHMCGECMKLQSWYKVRETQLFWDWNILQVTILPLRPDCELGIEIIHRFPSSLFIRTLSPSTCLFCLFSCNKPSCVVRQICPAASDWPGQKPNTTIGNAATFSAQTPTSFEWWLHSERNSCSYSPPPPPPPYTGKISIRVTATISRACNHNALGHLTSWRHVLREFFRVRRKSQSEFE